MLNKQLFVLVFLVCSIGIYSCSEKKYLGDVYTNYPDLNKILKDTWDQEEPYNYLKVTYTGPKQKDSIELPSDKMPWAEINEIFDKANIHIEKLDKHYTIDVYIDDTIANTQTLFYETLEPEDFTQSLNIVSSTGNSKVNNIYFKTNADGFLGAKSIKVLYIPEELLQIQKDGAKGIVVETYYFPE